MMINFNETRMDLTEEEIDSVLDFKNQAQEAKREYLANFFKIEKDKLSKQALTRFAQADKVMTKISADSAHPDISQRLVNTLKSVKLCYSYAEYLACIELCALLGEMLANFLCISDKKKILSINNNIKENKKKINDKEKLEIYYSDEYNQRKRLNLLKKAKVIDTSDEECLLWIHNLRISYFHHWKTKLNDVQDIAVIALEHISVVVAKYLEISGKNGKLVNRDNLERVRRYMAIEADN